MSTQEGAVAPLFALRALERAASLQCESTDSYRRGDGRLASGGHLETAHLRTSHSLSALRRGRTQLSLHSQFSNRTNGTRLTPHRVEGAAATLAQWPAARHLRQITCRSACRSGAQHWAQHSWSGVLHAGEQYDSVSCFAGERRWPAWNRRLVIADQAMCSFPMRPLRLRWRVDSGRGHALARLYGRCRRRRGSRRRCAPRR